MIGGFVCSFGLFITLSPAFLVLCHNEPNEVNTMHRLVGITVGFESGRGVQSAFNKDDRSGGDGEVDVAGGNAYSKPGSNENFKTDWSLTMRPVGSVSGRILMTHWTMFLSTGKEMVKVISVLGALVVLRKTSSFNFLITSSVGRMGIAD